MEVTLTDKQFKENESLKEYLFHLSDDEVAQLETKVDEILVNIGIDFKTQKFLKKNKKDSILDPLRFEIKRLIFQELIK